MSDLTERQEAFCCAYAGLDNPKYMGDGMRCYLLAFDTDNKNTARVNAHHLLKRRKIRTRVKEYLRSNLGSELADQELAYLMIQRKDYSAKMRAIKEYNKRRRDIENNTQMDFTFKDMIELAEKINNKDK